VPVALGIYLVTRPLPPLNNETTRNQSGCYMLPSAANRGLP